MTTSRDFSVLQQPIRHLDLSDYFVGRSIQMGFKTIQEIIDRDEDETAIHPAYTWKWFDELVEFMLKRDLAYLLDEWSRIQKHEAARIGKSLRRNMRRS